MIAAKEGSLPDSISLIAKTADVNAANRDGATALHFAAAQGHTEAVQALMEAKACVHIKTKVMYPSILEEWLRNQTDRVMRQAKETALQMASRNGHSATLRALKNTVHVSSLTALIEQTCKAKVDARRPDIACKATLLCEMPDTGGDFPRSDRLFPTNVAPDLADYQITAPELDVQSLRTLSSSIHKSVT
jgi:ankyrin repeat protein